jgi:hypothetical protein
VLFYLNTPPFSTSLESISTFELSNLSDALSVLYVPLVFKLSLSTSFELSEVSKSSGVNIPSTLGLMISSFALLGYSGSADPQSLGDCVLSQVVH